jgi:hypothetical protein
MVCCWLQWFAVGYNGLLLVTMVCCYIWE